MTTTLSPAVRQDPPAPAAPVRRRRRGLRAVDVVVLALTAVVLVAIVFPFFWMVLTSLRPVASMFDTSRLLPAVTDLTLANYGRLFEASDFGRYLANSFLVAVSATVISVVLSCLMGYAFSRFRFRGRRGLMLAVLGVQLFPFVILITPLYSFFSVAGLLNTYHGLVIAYVAITLPVASYLMMGYIDAVPRGLDEAARIDGCGPLGVLFRVVLPVAWPGVATVATLAFISSWEEYLFAKVLVTDADLRTVQVGLSTFFGEFTTEWDLVMSASVVASVPTIVLFAIAQRRLVAGLAVGGVKE